MAGFDLKKLYIGSENETISTIQYEIMQFIPVTDILFYGGIFPGSYYTARTLIRKMGTNVICWPCWSFL